MSAATVFEAEPLALDATPQDAALREYWRGFNRRAAAPAPAEGEAPAKPQLSPYVLRWGLAEAEEIKRQVLHSGRARCFNCRTPTPADKAQWEIAQAKSEPGLRELDRLLGLV